MQNFYGDTPAAPLWFPKQDSDLGGALHMINEIEFYIANMQAGMPKKNSKKKDIFALNLFFNVIRDGFNSVRLYLGKINKPRRFFMVQLADIPLTNIIQRKFTNKEAIRYNFRNIHDAINHL